MALAISLVDGARPRTCRSRSSASRIVAASTACAQWNELLATSAADNPFLTWEWLHAWWTHFGRPARLRVARRAARRASWSRSRRCGSTRVACVVLALRVPGHRRRRLGLSRSDRPPRARGRGVWRHRRVLASQRTRAAPRSPAAAARWRRGWPDRLAQRRLDVARIARTVLPVHSAWPATPWIRTWPRSAPRIAPTSAAGCARSSGSSTSRFERGAATTSALTSLERAGLVSRPALGGHGGSTAFSAARAPRVPRRRHAAGARRGWLRLYSRWAGRRPSAVMYGFIYDRRFYFYQHGYDDAYREVQRRSGR